MKKNIMIVSLLSALCLAGCAKKPVIPDSFSDINTKNEQGRYILEQKTTFNDYSIYKERHIGLFKSPDNKKSVSALQKHTKDSVVFTVKDYQRMYKIRYEITQGYEKKAKDHYPELLSNYTTKTTFIGYNNKLSHEKNKLVGINVVRTIAQQVVSEGIPQNPNRQLFTQSVDKSKLIYKIQSQLDLRYPDIFTVTNIDVLPLN